ncbi:MAG: hypothetical protein ABEI99_02945, partial [Halobaculum sp.]
MPTPPDGNDHEDHAGVRTDGAGTVTVPYGETTLTVSLPNSSVTVAEPPGGDAVDTRAAAERAL